MKSVRLALLVPIAVISVACGPDRPGPFGNDVVGSDAPVSDIVRDDVASADAADVQGADTQNPADTGVAPASTTIILPGAPADAPDRFGGAATTTAQPELVYPDDGTIIPPNLTGFEVHFRQGGSNDLFEVTFGNSVSEVRVYTGCTALPLGGCGLALDGATLDAIVRAAGSSGEVRVVVRGTPSSGGAVGTSAPRRLGITSEALRGGIYYWAASSGGINRYEFGLPGARSETYLRGDAFNCVGCHTLSRDGTRAAVGRFIPSPSRMRTLNVESRADISPEFGGNFSTFSPDNSLLLVSDGMRLALLDAATGAPANGLPANTMGSMPDWSPDGSRVVYSRPRTAAPFPTGSPGHSAPADLFVLQHGPTGFFGGSTLVMAGAGENNYYPSFSPDGRWVLFNRSGGESYDAVDAHLYVARADGAEPPARLAAADRDGNLSNSWPKWAPFEETYQGEPLMWFTFSSRRNYGLRIQQEGNSRERQVAQLWMAAFRPNAPASEALAAPAFWLPFQDAASGNHIAQWTREVRRRSCRNDMECAPDERCQSLVASGVCVAR